MVFRFLCVLAFVAATLLADAAYIREVQEELRKRNLFFGDIDGRVTPHLTNALRKYQKRKGFDVTGTADATTMASLQIQSLPPSAVVAATQPGDSQADINAAATQVAPLTASQPIQAADTISASDAATPREAAAELLAQAQGEAAWADLPVTPEPPAEAPTDPELITADRVNRFVETYLADGETDDIGLQVWFYGFPVRYFNHGLVDQAFVVRDTKAYVNRWPERDYTVVGPVTYTTAGPPGQIQIEFTIDYTVRNKTAVKSGRTKNFWTVRTTGDDMKIIAIREEHIKA